MAEDVAGVHERAEHLVQVQVGSADVGRRDLDDRVGGFLDLRVGDGVDADVALAVPGDCLHGLPSLLGGVVATQCFPRQLPASPAPKTDDYPVALRTGRQGTRVAGHALPVSGGEGWVCLTMDYASATRTAAPRCNAHPV